MYLRTVLSFFKLVLQLSFSILCHFTLLQLYISEEYFVLFTPLHLYDSYIQIASQIKLLNKI